MFMSLKTHHIKINVMLTYLQKTSLVFTGSGSLGEGGDRKPDRFFVLQKLDRDRSNKHTS